MDCDLQNPKREKMNFDHVSVRLVVTEDRLSRLPDELIHQILSCLDTKFAVQTCLLSPRWKFIWKSIPCLNFSSSKFKTLPKFSKFVTSVLTHRNHQVEVTSVKLSFNGATSQVFVRKIANYAYSHNVQNLTVIFWPKKHHEFPPCFFSSQSLKHLTFGSNYIFESCVTPKTPWDFPALTNLHLSDITLCDDDTRESVDLFSKCVNLKNLILKSFVVDCVKVFDIITPRLSSLLLIDGCICPNVVNVIAPQLENLTIINCSIKCLNAPSGILSLCYTNNHPLQLSKCHFHSLNKVNLHLYLSCKNTPYKEKDARNIINMLDGLCGARFLTLNLDIVECLSSFPDLISNVPSPFSNLVSLKIDSSRHEPYKVKISTETKNFFLENSLSATFITDLPEDPPTKAMIAKQAREEKNAKLVVEIESHMKELQALLENENNRLLVERKHAIEKTKLALDNHMARLQTVLMPNNSELAKESVGRIMGQILDCVKTLQDLIQQEDEHLVAIDSKMAWIKSLLEKLPKRIRADTEKNNFVQLAKIDKACDHLKSTYQESSSYLTRVLVYCSKLMFDLNSTSQDVSRSKLHVASQLSSSSSSSPIIPTPSASNVNPTE